MGKNNKTDQGAFNKIRFNTKQDKPETLAEQIKRIERQVELDRIKLKKETKAAKEADAKERSEAKYTRASVEAYMTGATS